LAKRHFPPTQGQDSSLSGTLLIGIAFFSYIAIGLPGGVLGVTWPSIRTGFGLPLDAIGALFVARTAGYLTSGYLNGQLVSKLGVGRFMALAGGLGTAGVLGYALSPSWGVMVACGILAGLGTGAIDAGMNTYFAAVHSPSLMNWLHACFGVGAALGPVLATTLLSGGHSWRWSYAVVAAALGLTALLFAATWHHWGLGNESTTEQPASLVRARATLRLPAVWLGVLMFMVFTGLEATGGQWPYTLFTEARSIDPTVAGLWVSVYWASLTVGRILFGIAAQRFQTSILLRIAMLGAICASALIWTPALLPNLNLPISFLGLALLGFSIAPIFPLSISDTPHLVGQKHAANAIGFQVAAASLGIAILPGLAGVLAQRMGLEVIGPFLVTLSVGMILLHEVAVQLAGRREPHA
jgi:fucose permease